MSTPVADMEYIVSKRVIVTFDAIIGVVSHNPVRASGESCENNAKILEFEHCPKFGEPSSSFEYPYPVPPSLVEIPTVISALIILDSSPH